VVNYLPVIRQLSRGKVLQPDLRHGTPEFRQFQIDLSHSDIVSLVLANAVRRVR